MKQFLVSDRDENQRIDKFVLKILKSASKSFVYKMFRKKNITLNSKKINGNEIVKKGDTICIYFSNETFEKFSKKEEINISNKIEFNIIYEDENVLVCNKPVGLLSQPDGENDSLVAQINYYYKDASVSTGICNRLDRNTSGLVIAGKNNSALQAINKAIKGRTVDKLYHCIVKGQVSKTSTIEGFLDKDQKSNRVTITKHNNEKKDLDYIKTIYEPLVYKNGFTLLKVKIITGKSHQIRAHLSSISLPIIGDYKYGDKQVNQVFKEKYGLKNQLLHAYSYSFSEIDGTLSYLVHKPFIAPYPDKLKEICDNLFGGDRHGY